MIEGATERRRANGTLGDERLIARGQKRISTRFIIRLTKDKEDPGGEDRVGGDLLSGVLRKRGKVTGRNPAAIVLRICENSRKILRTQ